MSASDPRRWWLVALGVGLVGAIFTLALTPTDVPADSDEAHHVLLGLKYQRDIVGGDLRGFVGHTLRTGRYPFFHGWLVGGAFLVFGQSLLVARATSAMLLGLAAALAALLVGRVRPNANPAFGLLAGVFVLLAPETFGNGVLCMLEVPGLTLSLLAAWLYHRHLDTRDSWQTAVLPGLVVILLLFTKYPYGAYMLGPLFVAEAARAWERRDAKLLFRPGSWLVWTPVLFALGAWFAIPQSRNGILMLLADAPDKVIKEETRDPFRIPAVQLDLVPFYLRTFAVRLAPGIVYGVLGLLGSAWVIVRGRNFERCVLGGALVWTTFTLLLSYRTFGVDRFLVPVAGLFGVLAVIGMIDLLARARTLAGTAGKVAPAALMVLLGVGAVEAGWRMLELPREVEEVVETTTKEAAAAEWVVTSIEYPANLLAVGAWDQLSEDSLHSEFLFRNPDARFDDVNIKAIRLGKIYQGTKRLQTWIDSERHWHPTHRAVGHRYMLFIEPEEALRHWAVDPEGMAQMTTAAAAFRDEHGAEFVASRSDSLARYVLYRLND